MFRLRTRLTVIGLSLACAAAHAASPALVQHVSASSSRNFSMSSPYCYYYQLPNLTTAGNAVIVGFTFNSNPTPTVTDDKNDAYQIVENYYDSGDTQSIAVAAAFNVAAGARKISVCFNANPGGYVQPMATEFSNVTGADGPGFASNGTGTSVSAGNMTPSGSGDMVYQVVASLSNNQNQSSFTAGSQSNITWNLLSADLLDGWAGQYGVYNSASPLNPAISLGTSSKWVSAAMLLKTGTAGSVPTGMRIIHLLHQSYPGIHTSSNGSAFPNPASVEFPSSGNLIVSVGGGGYPACQIKSMTDTNGNSWSQAGKTYQAISGGADTVQIYYAGNATTSNTLGISATWDNTNCDWNNLFYDVTGAAAAPLDTTNGATGSQSSAGALTMPYTITPSQSNELIFANIIWDYNTTGGLTGKLFDSDMFSGEPQDGPEPVDQNNGWAHYLAPDTSTVSFTWTPVFSGEAVGPWGSMAAAFKASGTSPPPPPTTSPCDINGDNVVNVADVQVEVNMALGISSCTNASGTCNVTSVQKVVNAALGGTCVTP